MPRPIRHAVLAALHAKLSEELAATESIAAMARDEVGSGEAKAEGKYDTRATEASYLARGQAWRIAALRQQVAWAARFDPERALAPTVVQVGALVQLVGAPDEWLFIAPVGGARLSVGGHTVKVVSPASPLGKAMAELGEGDAFEVETPRGELTHELAWVG